MKKILMSIYCCGILIISANAQAKEESDEETKGGFKKENLFTGGTVGLGFGQGSFTLGLGPYFGYSINKYVDVAVSLNYNYVSQRDYLEIGDKLRQSIIGPGVFTRIYPVKFLFAHAEFEQNFVKVKYLPAANGGYLPFKETKNVSSFLIGPGYAGGRDESNKTFFYISLLFDVAKNINSPYVDQQGRIEPIVRAGYNIALFQGREDRGAGGSRRRNRY